MELNKRIFFIAMVCSNALMFICEAQQVKYWVGFKNKDGNPYRIEKPSEFLGSKAICRRNRYNIPINNSDLPVTPDYRYQIENVPHVRVLYSSKWLNGVVISLESAQYTAEVFAQINNFSFVENSNKVKRNILVSAPLNTVNPQVPMSDNSAYAAAYDYGGAFWQNRQLNVDCLHEKGYRGQGMVIAVMDAGFGSVPYNSVFDSMRVRGNLLGTYDFVLGQKDVYHGSEHGTMVLSCMAGDKPGVIIGSAPLAKYWLFRTEDGPSETISEEYNWVRAAEFADSAGVDILTTSLGYTTFDDPAQSHSYASLNGRTAPMSIAATMAARKGLFVVNSAGNEGAGTWKYISVAADADSVCAVGAVDSAGKVADFSSVGPTPDGRIKPDLVARGAGAWACVGDAVCYPVNGTSFSGPILAGAVACFWQSQRSFNNIKILDELKRNASNAIQPNNSSGWGIPNMCALTPDGTPDIVCNPLPDGKPDFDYVVLSDKIASQIKINLYNNNYEYIKVGLYDLLGKILLSAELTNQENMISFSSATMSDNIYLLKIETPQGLKVKKIVKQ